MTISARDIDRLVDNELPLPDRQRLLQTLDVQSDGWKPLALAFLEAQAFQQACRGMVTDRVPSAPVMERPTTTSTRFRLARWVTTAAAIAVAFGLGAWTGRGQSTQMTSQEIIQPAPTEPGTSPPEMPAGESVQVVFAGADGQWSTPVEVPVVDASQLKPRGDYAERPAIPVALQEALRRAGRDVQQREEWVQVDFADGRRGLMPVQEWVVSPVQSAAIP